MISGSRNSSFNNSSRYPAQLLGWLLLSVALVSCGENELKNAKTISAKKIAASVERSEGVEVIYSDSAKVKAKLITPLLLHYQSGTPYREMPKGITLIFYDENRQEENRIVSRYATIPDHGGVAELRDHVVITTKAGDRFTSEQMFWDVAGHKFRSDKLLTRVSSKGEVGHASSFESDENFQHFSFPKGASGDMMIQEKQGPP